MAKKKIEVKEVEIKKDEAPQKPLVEEPTTEEKPVVEKIKEVVKLVEVEKPKSVKTRKKKTPSLKPVGSSLVEESEKVATGRSTGFYVGISIGIIIASIGGYLAYTKIKDYFENRNLSEEDKILKILEKEGAIIENEK